MAATIIGSLHQEADAFCWLGNPRPASQLYGDILDDVTTQPDRRPPPRTTQIIPTSQSPLSKSKFWRLRLYAYIFQLVSLLPLILNVSFCPFSFYLPLFHDCSFNIYIMNFLLEPITPSLNEVKRIVLSESFT